MVFSHKIQLSESDVNLLKNELPDLELKVGENSFIDLHIFKIKKILETNGIHKKTERNKIYSIILTQKDLDTIKEETKLRAGFNIVRKKDLEIVKRLGLKYKEI